MPPRRACSMCWDVPGGRTRRAGMRGAPLWWSPWASRRPSWSLMQPDVAKKVSMRQGWRGHRGAQQGGWSPASSGCAWPRPVAGAMPCGMVPARCPKTGAMMASASRALAYLRGPLGPRSRPWRARGSSRRAPPRGQQPGARAIGAMGMIGTGGCGWRSAPSLGPRRLGPGGGVAWLAAAPGQNARDRAAS